MKRIGLDPSQGLNVHKKKDKFSKLEPANDYDDYE